MARFKFNFDAGAFRTVLPFTFRHWRKQPRGIAIIVGAVLIGTLADVLTPLFAGRLVDAVANGISSDAEAWNAALIAFGMIVGLGIVSVIFRQISFYTIIGFTLEMMQEISAAAFHRVQRLSTDWHANSFAGSTVRKITRGMWALDILNDTLLIALFPSLVMLTGTTIVLTVLWPVMGAIVGLGSLIYVGVVVVLSAAFVAPAASLANKWDTRMGGALADAISCNPVVKGFGAEEREEERLSHVIGKWRKRTRRTWRRGTFSHGVQQAMLVALRGGIAGAAILLWAMGAAGPGDIAMLLTTFFVLQGYLRDVGQHIRNLQRSVNDMEELVEVMGQPLGVADRPGARPIVIREGAVTFRDVRFQYGKHLWDPLESTCRHASLSIL